MTHFIKQPLSRAIFLTLGLLTSAVHAENQPGAAVASSSITLQECYQRAKKISETVSISAENVRLLQEQYRAEIGAVLPHVDWIKSQLYQQNQLNGATGVAASSLKPTQPLSFFQITQPIFAGFRDWDVIAISKSQQEQARLNQQQTDLQLLADVSAAFYAAYTLQDQLSVLEETRKLNLDQVDQLNHWVNVGRSRPSEVLSAQTQLASLDAQIEETKRQIADSRHLLLFLSGVPADVPLQDSELAPSGLTVDNALTRAGKRPDLLSAAEAVNQSNLSVRYARGAHLPTLGLVVNSYTERTGFLSDVRWDATFLLDVPIYEGGSTQALVRAARAQDIIAQLNLARLKRDVDRQVRTAFEDFTRATTEVQAYDKAVQLAVKNYDAQKKEYRLGIINNLELLQLLTNTQEVRRQWLVSRANARLDDIQLRIAMGEGL